MAHAARLGALTDDLITSITASALSKDSRQFKQLKESALKTFKTHQHVRVNQFDVEARLEGLVEKFFVLNNEQLAEALQPRLDELAARSPKWKPEILALLLALSDRPVEKTNIDEALQIAPPEPVTHLTWADIIAEEPLTEDGIWDDVEVESDYSEHRAPSLSDVSVAEPTTSTQASSLDEDDAATLARAFIIPNDSQALDHIRDVRTRLTEHTESQLSELQITRQVLSMLHGLPSDIFDVRERGPIETKSTCRIANIAPATVDRMFRTFTALGSQIAVIRKLVASVQRTVVMERFQAAVEARLRQFEKAVSEIEQNLLQIGDPMVVSLISIHAQVDRIAEPLVRLTNLIPESSLSDSAQALQVLDRLFEESCTLQLVGEHFEFAEIAGLFLACLDPYLRSVKLWVTEGKIQASNEMFFVRSDDGNSDRGLIWHSRFTLARYAEGSIFAPKFLQGMAERIFKAGKSVMFLEALGQESTGIESSGLFRNLNSDHLIQSMDGSLLPFSEVFNLALTQWIDALEGPGTQTLRQMLMSQCGLRSTIKAIDHVYFGRHGAQFQTFAYGVFARIDRGIGWDDRFLLTELAQTAFGIVDGIDTDHISIRLKPAPNKNDDLTPDRRRSVVLDRIILEYSITWALQNVLSTETLATCQQAFTVLLRVYRAQYILHQQEWTLSIMAGHTKDSEVKQLLALRQHLAWFISTFRSYVSEVLSLATNQLNVDLDAAADVDGMAAAFDKFKSNLASKLLLQPNLQPIHRSLIGMLDLYEDFALQWRDAIKQLSDHSHRPTSRHRAIQQSHVSREKAGEMDDTMDLSADEDDGDTQHHRQKPKLSVSKLLEEYDRQLSFMLAGLRGVSRVGGESSWIMLSERLQWGYGAAERR